MIVEYWKKYWKITKIHGNIDDVLVHKNHLLYRSFAEYLNYNK